MKAQDQRIAQALYEATDRREEERRIARKKLAIQLRRENEIVRLCACLRGGISVVMA